MATEADAPAPAPSAEARRDDGCAFAERFAAEWLAQPANHETNDDGSTYRWLPELGEQEAVSYLARLVLAFDAAQRGRAAEGGDGA